MIRRPQRSTLFAYAALFRSYCANVASGTANIAVSSAARSAVDFIVISLGETASGDQQTPCRQITDSLLAATALFRAVDLAQCCLQPVSQLLRVVIRPEMHEEKPRLFFQ